MSSLFFYEHLWPSITSIVCYEYLTISSWGWEGGWKLEFVAYVIIHGVNDFTMSWEEKCTVRPCEVVFWTPAHHGIVLSAVLAPEEICSPSLVFLLPLFVSCHLKMNHPLESKPWSQGN
jgi:hypothetical protein